MDPVAIRSYLASLGQGGLAGAGGGGGGAGGVQSMLANLRNQLYGPQALQGNLNNYLGGLIQQPGGGAGGGQFGEGPAFEQAMNQAAAREAAGGGSPAPAVYGPGGVVSGPALTGGAGQSQGQGQVGVGQSPNDGPAPLDPNSPAAQFYRDALERRNMSGAGGPGGAGQVGGGAGWAGAASGAGGFSNRPMTLDPASLVRPDLAGGGPGQAGGGGSPFSPQILENLRQNTAGMTPEQVQAQIGGGPGGAGQVGGGAPAGGGAAGGASDAAAGMPFGVPPRLQELAARDPAAAQARYAAFRAGQLPGQQGGALQGTEQGVNQPMLQTPAMRAAAEAGGGRLAATAQPLPATMTAPISNTGIEALQPGSPGAGTGPVSPPRGVPTGVSGVAGAVGSALRAAGKPGASVSPATAAGNVRQAVQRTKPMEAAPSSAPNAAVLGAEEFKGPNARRIVQARGGIYNNVRQALRRPAGGGNKAGGG